MTVTSFDTIKLIIHLDYIIRIIISRFKLKNDFDNRKHIYLAICVRRQQKHELTLIKA